MLLLEKAVAKFYKGFDRLSGGSILEGALGASRDTRRDLAHAPYVLYVL